MVYATIDSTSCPHRVRHRLLCGRGRRGNLATAGTNAAGGAIRAPARARHVPIGGGRPPRGARQTPRRSRNTAYYALGLSRPQRLLRAHARDTRRGRCTPAAKMSGLPAHIATGSAPLMHPRFAAEWEPQSGVLLAWPHEQGDWRSQLHAIEQTYAGIAAAIARFEPVLILCRDEPVRGRAESACRARSIDGNRLRFLVAPYDDTWIRD